MKQEEIPVHFTRQELQALINLIDVAVRSRGLDIAANAVVIYSKIQNSIKEFDLSQQDKKPLE